MVLVIIDRAMGLHEHQGLGRVELNEEKCPAIFWTCRRYRLEPAWPTNSRCLDRVDPGARGWHA